ncbi:MAG: hypothetical protein KC635_15990 [Myxococcales bacterium]|nr:hypothetical protein [Myxococcales bacterium]MCB9734910.1 hypothetical protein [Deltaproteobacteria bacterium]
MNAYRRWGPLLGLLGVSACSGGGLNTTNTPGNRVQISAAALQLAGIADATYVITVTNRDEQTVWQETVTSSQYGDGKGDISYVGPCDADANPNHVALELLSLTDTSGAVLGDAEWVKPPVVEKPVTCSANADVFVSFDLSVMRAANQGFFDVAVNFEDIFCSAKVDCQDRFLHDPGSGERDLTAVVALACTAGPGQETAVYWSDAAIVCGSGADAVRYPIDMGAAPGNHGPIYRDAGDPDSDAVYQWATYFTKESLPNLDKCAWTAAIGLNLAELGPDCRFQATATAADHRFENPAMHTPTDAIYPVITYDVGLTGPSGALTCEPNPLDGDGSGVTTGYTTLDGAGFHVGAACADGVVFRNQFDCTGTLDGEPAVAFVPAEDGRYYVTYGDQRVGPFALPEGMSASLDSDECCLEPCCEEVQ